MTSKQKQQSLTTDQGSSSKSVDHHKSSSHVSEHDYHMDRVTKTKILLAMMSLYLVFDFLTRDYLFQLSVKHAQVLRTQYLNIYADKFFQYISELGDKYAVGVLIYMSYHTLDHPKSFIIILAASAALSFSCILKSLNHEPRPFFVADLQPNKCRFEYGNPSGHSYIATGLYLVVWDLVFRQYHEAPKLLKNLTLFSILFLLIPILAFSRIYNGVHTYNQVIGGLAWGFFTYYSLCHVFYYEICIFITRLKKKAQHGDIKHMIWNTFTQIFLVAYVIAVAIYFFNSSAHPIPDEWKVAIKKNCPKIEELEVDVELSNFVHYNLVWTILGAYTGIIVDYRYFPTAEHPYFYKTPLIVTLKRIVICAFIPLTTQSPMFLVSKKNPLWIVLVFRTFVPAFFSNLYIFGFMKYMAFRLGLTNIDLVSSSAADVTKQTILSEQFGDKQKKK